ncbi:alpha-mannosidase [Saccharicrinis sp. FJH62]|uniref:alpha-mannosidase n=1 Tax=Saccharicrinis sp. FJH62 TaxID=3344657 RepID=UPI0035D44E27
MKNTGLLILLILMPLVLNAQPFSSREDYDISKDKVLYTIGYSHLDTEWNWDYVTTIDECIKNIMTENFYLFEHYPDYVYNFTGSRRYHMMKEYYPDLYEKVKDYIHQGRWYVSGSSVDEGEVNISSSESLIRQVLYGNDYFRKEFGVESSDYMLPDCFGFLANLPTIWNHCGLLGFSTQKLTWHSAAGIPFNVGVWKGPDDKGLVCALNATSYTSGIENRLDLNDNWNDRLNDDIKKHGISFDYRYYGVGDMGGAPRLTDVERAVKSLKNNDSKFKVVLTSSDQMYKDITPEIRAKLPEYKGDLLLIEHSAGSLTSQAFMKRMNRKNELLAKSAEQLAVMADWKGGVPYPSDKLNRSWELVLGSQFHDILPGTSIPKAYEYAWNDEFIAANGFAEVLKSSVSSLSGQLNTKVKGRPLVVYNPVERDREDVVSAELTYEQLPAAIQAYNPDGKPVPTQIIATEGKAITFIFLAKVPSSGMAVYDVRSVKKAISFNSQLAVTDKTIENKYYRVVFASNGDMTSIYDKTAQKELLSEPAKLEFQTESPEQWPAWNMDWEDRKNPPVDFMDNNCSIRIAGNGEVRVALEITRKGRNSEITQMVSLAAGEAGKRIEVSNTLDWQSKGVSLKAAFPLIVSNEKATYNLGVGTLQRGNNNSVKFEVPAKQWFDLTDISGDYGVTILEDCKYGSDKPADNKLRLTLLYTPENKNWYPVQQTQDWGIHQFRYGIYGHAGSWQNESQWQGKFFNQPLMAFEAPKHSGKAGKTASFLSLSTPQIGVMAFKKMENSDYYLVRVTELNGNDLDKASLSFAGNIQDAYEVSGQEKRIGDVKFESNQLNFGMTHYTIRSFAVKLKDPEIRSDDASQIFVDIPYNQDVMSWDYYRNDGDFQYRINMPAELIPDTLVSDGILFKMGSKENEADNVVNCRGQQITLPEGDFNRIYILAAADEETNGEFVTDDVNHRISVQRWTGNIGQFYNRNFANDGQTVTSIATPFAKDDNIAWFASHTHQCYPSKNRTYQYAYMYKYEIVVPKGAKTFKFPDNSRIKVLAVTAAKLKGDNITPVQPLYDNFKNSEQVVLR